jgi:hypothetical protein
VASFILALPIISFGVTFGLLPSASPFGADTGTLPDLGGLSFVSLQHGAFSLDDMFCTVFGSLALPHASGPRFDSLAFDVDPKVVSHMLVLFNFWH